MTHSGYTVTPQVSEDASGQAVLSGFEFQTAGGYDSRYEMQDLYEDQQGNIHHVMEDVELQDEGGSSFDDNQYLQDVIASTDGLSEALTWADTALDEELKQLLSDQIFGDDMDAMHEALDQILNLFLEHGDVEQEEQLEHQEEQTAEEQDESDVVASEDDLVAYNETVFEAFGGKDSYFDATQYAADTADPEFVELFNNCMDSSSYSQMSEAFDWLMQFYANR